MDDKKIVFSIILIIILISIIISEIISYHKEYPEADKNTKSSIKVHGRWALAYSIIGLIFYLIYEDI